MTRCCRRRRPATGSPSPLTSSNSEKAGARPDAPRCWRGWASRMADAFIACWNAKFEYDLLRPVTYIKRVIDPKWEPLLITPPFPEYPSGHSTQSGAAAAVLTSHVRREFRLRRRAPMSATACRRAASRASGRRRKRPASRGFTAASISARRSSAGWSRAAASARMPSRCGRGARRDARRTPRCCAAAVSPARHCAADARRAALRRGDGDRRHRQRLCGRVGIHGRRRRRHLRLQRRRLRRHAAGRRREARDLLPQPTARAAAR